MENLEAHLHGSPYVQMQRKHCRVLMRQMNQFNCTGDQQLNSDIEKKVQ
jgi:hypothetical protein